MKYTKFEIIVLKTCRIATIIIGFGLFIPFFVSMVVS